MTFVRIENERIFSARYLYRIQIFDIFFRIYKKGNRIFRIDKREQAIYVITRLKPKTKAVLGKFRLNTYFVVNTYRIRLPRKMC